MVDKLVSPPKHIEPQQEYKELTKPPPRNNLPATPLKEQKHSFKIYELLEQAKTLSHGLASKYVAASKNYRETYKEVRQVKQTTYCAAHIIESDAEYVSIVSKMSITDKGAMNLLLANGGRTYLDRGLTAAQAFDLLRRDRMRNLLPAHGKDCDKRPEVKGKFVVFGKPTEEDMWLKALQSAVKHKD
jgi:hypothetical protein